MSSVCSNASSKTWMPLPDHFIDEHLVEMFPLFDQVNVMNLAAIYKLLQLHPNLVAYRVPVRTVVWPQSTLWAGAHCIVLLKSRQTGRCIGN